MAAQPRYISRRNMPAIEQTDMPLLQAAVTTDMTVFEQAEGPHDAGYEKRRQNASFQVNSNWERHTR